MSNRPHNFRVVHRYGVSTTPRVIQCLNTGKLAELPNGGNKPGIIQAHGQTFHVLKRHTGTRNHVQLEPYVGNWPKLSFYFKRCMELFA